MTAAATADNPVELSGRDWKLAASRVKEEFRSDHVTLSASGVAFHAFLALVPLLAAAASIYGLFADPDNVARLIDRLGATLPADVSTLVENQLTSIASAGGGALGLGAAVGIISGVWSASSGVAHLMEGINIAYDEDTDDRPFWKKRGVAVLLTMLVLAFLAMSATVITFAASANGAIGIVVLVAAWALVAAMLATVLAVFYRYGPDRSEPEWAWVTPGAIFTVLAWTVASFGFGLYVSRFGSYNETYGSLGAVVVVLLWLFISATVIIVGAELNTELERQTHADSTVGSDDPIGERDALAADEHS